jgi:hypothetical protein
VEKFQFTFEVKKTLVIEAFKSTLPFPRCTQLSTKTDSLVKSLLVGEVRATEQVPSFFSDRG